MSFEVRFAALLALAAMVLVSGCGSTAPGSPSPRPASSTAAGSTAGTSGKPTLPPRPREIKLDRVDPCALLSSDQLAQLALATDPQRGTTTAGDSSCVYEALDQEPPEISFTVSTVLDHDVSEVFLPNHGDTAIQVATFPAVRQPADADGPRPCTVIVSTTGGQFLSVWLNYRSTENHLSMEQACELTVTAAEYAMETLQMQR